MAKLSSLNPACVPAVSLSVKWVVKHHLIEFLWWLSELIFIKWLELWLAHSACNERESSYHYSIIIQKYQQNVYVEFWHGKEQVEIGSLGSGYCRQGLSLHQQVSSSQKALVVYEPRDGPRNLPARLHVSWMPHVAFLSRAMIPSKHILGRLLQTLPIFSPLSPGQGKHFSNLKMGAKL